MKKKHLEMILDKIPRSPSPNSSLEQYQTPSWIAADALFTAYWLGDISNKKIFDFGCGTGIFAIGASLLGAREVIGIDIDEECLKIAEKKAREMSAKLKFIHSPIDEFHGEADTVIMNPPFGAQKKKADRIFIERGIDCAPIVYSMHLTKTKDFIEKIVNSLNGVITHSKEYNFPIEHQFNFHNKKLAIFKVTLFRIEK
jgi:putative methylase